MKNKTPYIIIGIVLFICLGVLVAPGFAYGVIGFFESPVFAILFTLLLSAAITRFLKYKFTPIVILLFLAALCTNEINAFPDQPAGTTIVSVLMILTGTGGYFWQRHHNKSHSTPDKTTTNIISAILVPFGFLAYSSLLLNPGRFGLAVLLIAIFIMFILVTNEAKKQYKRDHKE